MASEDHVDTIPCDRMGDLVVVLLACTLASLRDQLAAEGYDQPAQVVADLVEITNDYLDRLQI
jgi:hypothetical protein